MARIAFNIKYRPEIESGEYKVVTSNNEPVKILTFERKHRFPILALINRGYDEITEYDTNGFTQYAGDTLYLITDEPEPQLTEFEKELIKIMKAEGSPIGEDISKYTDGDIALMHSYSERLLTLARKQLRPEVDAEIDKAYKNSDAVQYRRGKEDALKELYCNRDDYKEAVSEKIRNMVSKLFTGDRSITSKTFADEFAWELLTLAKAEALKDVPKWKFAKEGQTEHVIFRELDVNGDYHYGWHNGVMPSGMEYITVEDLARLKRDE